MYVSYVFLFSSQHPTLLILYSSSRLFDLCYKTLHTYTHTHIYTHRVKGKINLLQSTPKKVPFRWNVHRTAPVSKGCEKQTGTFSHTRTAKKGNVHPYLKCSATETSVHSSTNHDIEHHAVSGSHIDSYFRTVLH